MLQNERSIIKVENNNTSPVGGANNKKIKERVATHEITTIDKKRGTYEGEGFREFLSYY